MEEKKDTLALRVPLLRQSDGKPSVSFTMLFICFNIIMLWLLLSIFEINVGPVKIRAFDWVSATSLISVFAANYFGRKFTDAYMAIKTGVAPPAASEANKASDLPAGEQKDSDPEKSE
jgi:hypothetical protein